MEMLPANPGGLPGSSEAEPSFHPRALRLNCVLGGRPVDCGPVANLAPSLAGIPTLIVLDPQGEVITRQGRVEVLNDEDCRGFPWHPKPVLELSDSNAVQLNEGPCLVLFVGMKLSGSPRVGRDGQSSLGGGLGSLSPHLLSVASNAGPGPLSPRLPCS